MAQFSDRNIFIRKISHKFSEEFLLARIVEDFDQRALIFDDIDFFYDADMIGAEKGPYLVFVVVVESERSG